MRRWRLAEKALSSLDNQKERRAVWPAATGRPVPAVLTDELMIGRRGNDDLRCESDRGMKGILELGRDGPG